MLKKMYHVKNPKIETVKSLEKFLDKYGYDKFKLILLKDFSSYRAFLNLKKGVPNAMFFNERGEYVDYRTTPEECNASVGKFFQTIEAINQVNNPDSLSIQDLNHLLQNEINVKDEITVIMTWAVFAGKVNKDKSLNWITHLKDAQMKGVKINYYLLNCDVLDTWGIDPKELKKSKIKG